MKLISCNRCGVVLNADKLYFPSDIYLDYGEINREKAAWSDKKLDYVAKISCPVCKEDILEE